MCSHFSENLTTQSYSDRGLEEGEIVAWSEFCYLQPWPGKVLYASSYCHTWTQLWTLDRECKNQDLHLYFIFRFHLWNQQIYNHRFWQTPRPDFQHDSLWKTLSWNMKYLGLMCIGSAHHFCDSFACFLNKHKVCSSSVAILSRIGAVFINRSV